MTPILTTQRLTLRELMAEDAPFILELLNDLQFLKYIGDRKVRTVEDAEAYIENGPGKSYRENGFGLYRTAIRAGDVPIGICGLVKRDTLEDPDLGFAFLQRFCSRGYGYESALAILKHSLYTLELEKIAAITSIDNTVSAKLLEKLGFQFEGVRSLQPGDEVHYYLYEGQ